MTTHLEPWQYETNLRHPYVRLFFQGVEIPLLDASRGEAASNQNKVQPVYLQSFNHDIISPLYGGSSVSLVLLDPAFDYLQAILFENEKSTTNSLGFSFRYGWRGRDEQMEEGVATNFALLHYEVEVLPFRGSLVTLSGRDITWRFSMTPMSLAFPESMPISEVIKLVAEATVPGMQTDIIHIPVPVGRLHLMENQRPLSYIRDLLNISRTVDGHSLFSIRIVEGDSFGKTKLVVKPYTMLPPRTDARTTYIYGRRNSELLSFRATMHNKGLYQLGGSRLAGVSVDPLLKVWKRVESTQDEDLVPSQQSSRANPIPSEPSDVVESPLDSESTKNVVKYCRGSADSTGYTAEATVLGNVALHPYDALNIVVLKNDPTKDEVTNISANDVHWFSSGLYTIWKVSHVISNGAFRTRLNLFRAGGFEGLGSGGQKLPLRFDPIDRDPDTGHVLSRVQSLQNPDVLKPQTNIYISEGF